MVRHIIALQGGSRFISVVTKIGQNNLDVILFAGKFPTFPYAFLYF